MDNFGYQAMVHDQALFRSRYSTCEGIRRPNQRLLWNTPSFDLNENYSFLRLQKIVSLSPSLWGL